MRKFLIILANNIWRDILIIFLALISVFLLIYELSANLTTEQIGIIHLIDWAVVIIFLLDFTGGLYLAESKKRYFRTHWTDLVASIPVVDGAFRAFRALRLLRLIKVIKKIRKMTDMSDKVSDEASKYIYIITITVSIVLSASVSFFYTEYGINPNVNNFFDAIWWAIATVTTVGYGDVYPVTTEGRFVAMGLMVFGIGLFAAIVGLIGRHFLYSKN